MSSPLAIRSAWSASTSFPAGGVVSPAGIAIALALSAAASRSIAPTDGQRPSERSIIEDTRQEQETFVHCAGRLRAGPASSLYDPTRAAAGAFPDFARPDALGVTGP